MTPIIAEDGRPDSIFSERRCRENRLRGRNEPPQKTNKKGATPKTPASSAAKGRGQQNRAVAPVQPSDPSQAPAKPGKPGLYETIPFRLNQTTYKTPKNDEFNIIV